MPDLLLEIKSWNGRPKALNELLAARASKDMQMVPRLMDALKGGNDKEKGVCLEVLEAVTRERPEWAADHLPDIMGLINHKAPKVKWESSRVVANLASKYPDRTAGAIPMLLANTTDKGTVVRWSAAFALGEILKSSVKERKALLGKVEKILKTEKNNGVRNVYLKAMKAVNKTGS